MDSDNLTVFGIIEPTDKDYVRYKKIYDLCEAEGVNLPKEVEEYFEGDNPEEKLKKKLNCIRNDSHDYITRLELNVKDIPKEISKIVVEFNWD